MQTHNLVQGSKEWDEFRTKHFGASEAAAMLGLSKQLSRNDLLLYKKTGKSKEYSDWVQANILDYGHEVEAMARELLESELGDELYPVTCSDGMMLSASCDGLTIDGYIAFEHKQYNSELADFIVEHGTLPDTHMPQCQQILLVTGAQKVIFVCSDGTANNSVKIEIFPDQQWFDRISVGWSQFAKDLQDFAPREIAEKPEPAAIMQLPSLAIQIKGEVTVSNLPQFKAAAEEFISKISTDLQTDEDFVNAEATVKFCDETEKKLESAKAAAIGQTASIDELMRTIDFIKESIRTKRLTLEKLVKTQKETIKSGIINDGFNVCFSRASELDLEFPQINFVQIAETVFSKQNFEVACKNKRTLASLHNAVDTEVASIKIKLDDLARVIRKNLSRLPEDLSLFRDLQSIVTKPEDDFKLLVQSRLAEQKRKEEEAAQRAIEAAREKEIAEQARIAAAQIEVAKRKEEETKRSLPTDIKSVLADEEKQLDLVKNNLLEPSETNIDSKEAFDITIPKSRYMDLLRSEAKLESLMCYGVDNWEGWDDAMAVYNDKLKEL